MNPVKNTIEAVRLLVSRPDHYTVSLARTTDQVRQAQALRFQVFNIELEEGLQQSFETGLDVDQFDTVCDHLLVEHLPSQQAVGTYRLQSGANAAAHYGYYCEQEFEFSRFEWARGEIIELGRACVQREHRNLVVLGLLWKGIADYARVHGGRYLLGCSSLTSQDPGVGASAYNEMYRRHLAPAEWRTRPRVDYDCPLEQLSADAPRLPKLLRAYLGLGAKICGPPALDRNFKTIDFLTLLDLQTLPAPVRSRFLDSPAQL
jgi:putative hemolysin